MVPIVPQSAPMVSVADVSFKLFSPPDTLPLPLPPSCPPPPCGTLPSSSHSFILAISIAPLQVHYYSEALLTQHGYCVGVSRQSATSNCELRTCPRSLHGGKSRFKPTTLRSTGIDSTNEPPRPTCSSLPSMFLFLFFHLVLFINLTLPPPFLIPLPPPFFLSVTLLYCLPFPHSP